MTRSLRPYQTAFVARLRSVVQQGARRVCCVAPAGSGKTTCFSAIMAGHLQRAPHHQGLVIVHRRELKDQATRALMAAGVSMQRCAVETVQSMLAADRFPSATMVIWDECHHAPADTWSKAAEVYRDAILLGFTATPERGDGRGLGGSTFERMVVAVQPSELIASGYLVPCEVIAPSSRLKGGQIAQSPVTAYEAHAPGEVAIVFSPTVAIAEDHCRGFTDRGHAAEALHGAMGATERDAIIGRFRSGQTRVLVNCAILTEGFDHPPTSCIILARGASTAGAFIQTTARASRPYPGKTRALLLDLVGASHVHGAPDEDRVFSLDGKGIRRSEQDVDVAFCAVCGAVKTAALCTECGHQAEPVTQEVTGERLVKFAKKRAEDDEQRARTLARWLLEARSKGWKPGSALFKYAAVYGAMPPANVRAAANYLLSMEAA